MIYWKHIPGWLTNNEGRVLQKYCLKQKILEIGSFQGRSSICISSVAKYLLCVDNHITKEFLENTNEIKNLEYLQMTSDDYFKNNKQEFDIIFIDGDHSYEQTVKDINNSLLLNPKYIICHDYENTDTPDVKIACDNIFKSIYECEGTLVVYRVQV